MTKISALTPLGDGLAVGDQFIIRDIDDAGTPNKSVTISGITRGLEVGTALAPSIAFAADKNTGIYGTGSDVLALVTAGENRLHITAGGLVGIGTSSPSSKLEIGGATNGSALTFSCTSSSPATERLLASVDYKTGNIGSTTMFAAYSVAGFADNASTLRFYTDTGTGTQQERLRITGAGNVGIGSTGPSELLHVNGNALIEDRLLLQRLQSSDNLSVLTFADTLTGSKSNNLSFGNPGGFDLLFHTGGVEKARIDSSGRLLVGTSTHQGNSILQVQGEAGAATAAGVLYLRRGLNTAAIGANVGADLGKIQWGANDGTIGAWIQCLSDATWSSTSDTPSALVFSTTGDGSASPTERMRIDSSGFVLAGGISNNNSRIVANISGVLNGVASRTTAAAGTGYSHFSASVDINGSLADVFYVSGNGNVKNTNNSYGALSDAKLKENIVDATSQWADVKAFRVRKYNFKEGQTHTQIGLVAQEVELVSPGLVTESPDRDAEGNDLGTVTKSVNYSVLYMKAVKALQEAMERIEALEARLTAAGIE